jgi:hypothetical protein
MIFSWEWSYQNRSGYRFYGFPKIGDGEIEVCRPLGWLESYMRETHNGGPESFKLNVTDAIRGAVIHRHTLQAPADWNRWSEPLYRAFVDHLTDNHTREMVNIEKYASEHPDIDYSEFRRPPVIPRPIYWDTPAGCYQTEPWHARFVSNPDESDYCQSCDCKESNHGPEGECSHAEARYTAGAEVTS